MSSWLSESELSMRLGYKILIAGLSEAGKTAVKRIFFLKQKTKEVDSIAATINYERLIVKIGGIPVTIVDLGGQKVFLKRFLGSFSPFVFSAVNAFVFLIDVENKTTKGSALQYFKGCIEKLQAYSPNAQFFVFLHKNDLVQQLPNYESIHAQLKEQFQLESEKIISFFRTTIYRPGTVIDAFGRIFEISLPRLKKSDYVDGRIIGEIDEYAEKVVTYREPTVVEAPTIEKGIVPQALDAQIKKGVEPEAPAEAVGDPAVLERLQGLMRGAVVEKSSVTGAKLPTKAVSEQPGLTTAPTSTLEEPSISLEEPLDEEIPTEAVVEDVLPPEKELDRDTRINHLIDHYGIQADEAIKVIKSGYLDVFEVAATARIPIPLVLNVLLKYLPFIKSKGLKVETLDKNRLIDVFFGHLTGSIKEDELLKCLIFAATKPEMTIDEISQHPLIKSKKTDDDEDLPIEKPTQKFMFDHKEETLTLDEEKIVPIKTELPKRVRFSVPIEAESEKGLVVLPESQGISFSATLDANSNVILEFYQEGHLVGKSLVSSTISIVELMYLFSWELPLPFEGGIISVHFASMTIFSTIEKLLKENLRTSNDIKIKEADKIQFIVPIELEADENFLRIPDSRDVTFKIESVEAGFQLSFRQEGYSIGQATVNESIRVPQLKLLMSEVMLLPIESDGAFEFAARLVYATLRILKQESISSSTIIQRHDTDLDDESSEELKRYVEILQILRRPG